MVEKTKCLKCMRQYFYFANAQNFLYISSGCTPLNIDACDEVLFRKYTKTYSVSLPRGAVEWSVIYVRDTSTGLNLRICSTKHFK